MNSNIYSNLCEYYDLHLSKEYPLFTKKINISKSIIISFDDNWNFNVDIHSNDGHAIIPVTVKSMKRTSGLGSHPLSDKVTRIFNKQHMGDYLDSLGLLIEITKDERCAKLFEFLDDADRFSLIKEEVYREIKDKKLDDPIVLWKYNNPNVARIELYDDYSLCENWSNGYISHCENDSSRNNGDCMVTGHKDVTLLNPKECPKFGELEKIYTSDDDDWIYGGNKLKSNAHNGMISYGLLESFKVLTALNFLVSNGVVETNKKKKFTNKTNCIDLSDNEWFVVFQSIQDETTKMEFSNYFSTLNKLNSFNNSGEFGNIAVASTMGVQNPNVSSSNLIEEASCNNLKLYAMVVSNTCDGHHSVIVNWYELDYSSTINNIDNFKRYFVCDGNVIPPYLLFKSIIGSKRGDTTFRFKGDKLSLNKSIMFGLPLDLRFIGGLIKKLKRCASYDNEFNDNLSLLKAVMNYNRFVTKEDVSMDNNIDYIYGKLYGSMCLVESSYNFEKGNKTSMSPNASNKLNWFKRNPIAVAGDFMNKQKYMVNFLQKKHKTLAIDLYNDTMSRIATMKENLVRCVNDDTLFYIGMYDARNEYFKKIEELKMKKEDQT